MSTLSPLDLLYAEDNEQKVLLCLSRIPQLTIAQISKETDIPINTLTGLLNAMVKDSRIVEQLKENQRVFSVGFGPARTKIRNLPSGLLDIFEQSPLDFLAKLPLIERLESSKIQALLDKSKRRLLVTDELLLWQGEHLNQIGLVFKGIIKKSHLQAAQLFKGEEFFLHPTEWIGIEYILNGSTSLHTYTAVTDCELLLWAADDFKQFLQQNIQFSMALNHWLSQRLCLYEERNVYGLGKLWVIEATNSAVGATTLAVNLALLLANQQAEPSRVILWPFRTNDQAVRNMMGLSSRANSFQQSGVGIINVHEKGLHILQKSEHKDYPLKVQIDILISNLREKYDYIICDTGAFQSEAVIYLRRQAHILATVTNDPNESFASRESWRQPTVSVRTSQKRFAILNHSNIQAAEPHNPLFHFVIPDDPHVNEALNAGVPVVDSFSESDFTRALQEISSRFSHACVLGVFIPLKEPTHEVQKFVQSTLSFLKDTFANDSKLEGIWNEQLEKPLIDSVVFVRTYVSEAALDAHLSAVLKFVAQLKEDLAEDAIAAVVNDQLLIL